MNPYVYLFGAIILEVCGTMMLPFTENFTKPLPSVALVVLYTASFYLMTFTLGQIPLGVVYATWSGLGVFTVALLSYFLLNQSLNWQAVLGLLLIVTGVILVNSFVKMPTN
ncbi:MAG: QacE family quaternary ammonium compound efflux SMR transporter [Alphaproteobacteria bacterium]|nr:QacE family quaternary ammonium compound efflux SMR transporter [Alphaproteobacteria bacterium]